jgi:hypothetical protein
MKVASDEVLLAGGSDQIPPPPSRAVGFLALRNDLSSLSRSIEVCCASFGRTQLRGESADISIFSLLNLRCQEKSGTP